MKQIIAFIAFLLIASTGNAQQKLNEDSVLTLMQNDICDQMGKAKASDFTADNFQMKMGLMFMDAFGKHNDALTQLYGEDYMTNQDKMMGMAQKMGMNLAFSCKAFTDIVMSNPDLMNAAMAQNPMKMPKKSEASDTKKTTGSISGKILSYTPAELSFYTVKVGNQTKKVYWLGKFEGDDELIANPKKIVGKTVSFETSESKVYSASAKAYKKIMVIDSFSSE